jgi:anaerobic magnesium-protoporphyrin IX monomethyl ester cyclase
MKILLVIYDNDSYIHWFPMGMAYLASALRNAGHHVTIYQQDQYHYPDAHLTDYLCENFFDVVGVGVIGGYYQYRKLLALAAAINAVPQRPFFVIGGHGPSPEPEYFLRKTCADAVVIGEGEETFVELLATRAAGGDLAAVPGLCLPRDGGFVRTPARAPLEAVDALPYPAWDLFPMDYYALLRMPHSDNRDRVLPVLGGRGCPYTCNFCYRMDPGIRLRSARSIVDEIRILQERYHVTYIAFMDELLMSSARRTRELCEALLAAHVRVKWCCNGRLNVATPEVLKLMRAAGCVFINYGIECMDDAILKVMNKRLTTAQIVAGIEATLAADISPGYNIIFGNIGESRATLQKGVDFLLKYDDHAQLRTIRPVTPYPGSPLYYHAISSGLLAGPEDFYEHKHTNSDLLAVNFTELSDDEFHAALYDANRTLLRNHTKHHWRQQEATARQLYLEKDASFRGFRQS